MTIRPSASERHRRARPAGHALIRFKTHAGAIALFEDTRHPKSKARLFFEQVSPELAWVGQWRQQSS